MDRNGDGVLQYVMLEGEPSHQDALLRTEYSIKTLTNAGVLVEKLASDTANWNQGQAAAKMSQWHQEFGSQIEAVFANNDDMALGAIDVLLEAGVAPEEMPVIVGVDATVPALEAMAAGTLSGTVQNAKEMPQVLMDLALSLYAGEDPAPGCRSDGRALCLAPLPGGQPGKFSELPGGMTLRGLAPPPVLCYVIFSKNKGSESPWLHCGSWRSGRATPPPPSPGSCQAIRRCR